MNQKLPEEGKADLPSFKRDITLRLYFALITIAIALFGIGGWAVSAQLASAVVAPGKLVVASHAKAVQHPTGGVVSELLVEEGQRVKAGQVLVRLDDVQTRATLNAVNAQLIELVGKRARLAAISEGRDTIAFSSDFGHTAEERRVMAGEQRLFDAKTRLVNSQLAQLEERKRQLEDEIDGLSSQRLAKMRERDLLKAAVERTEELYASKFATLAALGELQRDFARVEGEAGALAAQIARTRGEISEVGIQGLTLMQDASTEAQAELREVEAKIAELKEEKIAAEDQLRRIEIVAPIDGLIHEMAIHTVGGVVTAALELMTIVPLDDQLIIEAQVSPGDIDQIAIGLPARLRFTAFNRNTTPEFDGVVINVSPDLTLDETTGQSFYLARVAIETKNVEAIEQLKLTAGMPVEAVIVTGERTAFSYLTKPLRDHFARAFREE